MLHVITAGAAVCSISHETKSKQNPAWGKFEASQTSYMAIELSCSGL